MDIDEDFATVTTAPVEERPLFRGMEDESQRPLWGDLQIRTAGYGHLYNLTSGFLAKCTRNQQHGIGIRGYLNFTGWDVSQPAVSSA